MAFVYHIRTKEITSLDDGYVGVTGTNNNNKTPLVRLEEHNKAGRFCAYGKKEDLIVDVLFEGPDEECFDLEKKLRPSERIGWNISPGGEGGFKGNHFVKQNGMPWNNKAQQTRRERLESGKIQVWNKGIKLTGEALELACKKLPDRAPWIYTIEHKETKEILTVVGRVGIQEATGWKNINSKNFPWVILEKQPKAIKRKKSCAL
jgi:hypothetical protein